MVAMGLALLIVLAALAQAHSPVPAAELTGLRLAQHHFLSGRFQAAADVAAPLRSGPDGLAAYELRTSALHFQLRRLIGEAPNKGKVFRQCADCQGLLDAFMKDLNDGKALAKAQLKTNAENQAA